MTDTNVNLTSADLSALNDARGIAWAERKAIRRRRYERQYVRGRQRIARKRGQAGGFISFKLFLLLTRLQRQCVGSNRV